MSRRMSPRRVGPAIRWIKPRCHGRRPPLSFLSRNDRVLLMASCNVPARCRHQTGQPQGVAPTGGTFPGSFRRHASKPTHPPHVSEDIPAYVWQPQSVVERSFGDGGSGCFRSHAKSLDHPQGCASLRLEVATRPFCWHPPLSFPRRRESRESWAGSPRSTSNVWIPACAGMTGPMAMALPTT